LWEREEKIRRKKKNKKEKEIMKYSVGTWVGLSTVFRNSTQHIYILEI
jgi:hypothetical protein